MGEDCRESSEFHLSTLRAIGQATDKHLPKFQVVGRTKYLPVAWKSALRDTTESLNLEVKPSKRSTEIPGQTPWSLVCQRGRNREGYGYLLPALGKGQGVWLDLDCTRYAYGSQRKCVRFGQKNAARLMGCVRFGQYSLRLGDVRGTFWAKFWPRGGNRRPGLET